MALSYWLMKTEPGTYSIHDLAAEADQRTSWEGVRNYQARNLLRDEIHEGDRVLLYHSGSSQPAVVGTATVVREAFPDPSAWDRRSAYYDRKSTADDPRWFAVDIQLDQVFDAPLPLSELREQPALREMELLRKGSRLSVQPVRKKEYAAILKLAGAAR